MGSLVPRFFRKGSAHETSRWAPENYDVCYEMPSVQDKVMDPQVLTYEGCNFLRQRLVLSTLSSRPVRITNIREDADEPGLRGQLLVLFSTLPSQACFTALISINWLARSAYSRGGHSYRHCSHSCDRGQKILTIVFVA